MALPRTAKEAIRQGRTKVDLAKQQLKSTKAGMTLSKDSAEPIKEVMKWVRFNVSKQRGKPCAIGPSTTPGMVIVCYYNADLDACSDCFEVPESDVVF